MDGLDRALRHSRGYWLIIAVCLVIALWPFRPRVTDPPELQSAHPHLIPASKAKEEKP